MMSSDLFLLLHAGTAAARDRFFVLYTIATIGREVSEDAVLEAMAERMPPWTWESVVHCCADLADGGALERIRNDRDDVIGWRITEAAASHMRAGIYGGCTAEEAAEAPAWLLALPAAPKPTTTSMTIAKAVES